MVAEELLDGTNVVACFEQVCGEAVPERVASGGVRDPCSFDRFSERPLDDGFVQVVPAALPCLQVQVAARRGKYPLPSPVAGGGWVFRKERARKLDESRTFRQVSRVQSARLLELHA